MAKNKFKKGFLWGVASASYQIEGAWCEDGKEPSIWDDFSHEGKIKDGQAGDVACDSYHRYEEDIKLIKGLSVDVYRISVSMPRIIKSDGSVNEAGLDYYNRVIDCCIKNGITPYLTLYHWDLPSYLQQKGGFLNREVITEAFKQYATVVGARFGDRVKNFITLNEPFSFISNGYAKSRHAPGLSLAKKDILTVMHNALLCHGVMVRALRDTVKDCRVGITTSSWVACPLDENDQEDIECARRSYVDINEENPSETVVSYCDPIYLGDYPKEYYEAFADILPEIREGDMSIISQKTDFIGHNIYTGYKIGKDGRVQNFPNVQGACVSSNNWEFMPESIYWGIKFLYERYNLPIIITENGVAVCDLLNERREVRDEGRIDFVSAYLRAVKKASDEGARVDGYFYWSYSDNLEWAAGYRYRFGLVYIDYKTLKRIPKHSYYWYRRVVKSNGKALYSKRFSLR